MCAVDKRVSLPNATFLIHPINYGGRDTLPNNEAAYKYAKLLDNI